MLYILEGTLKPCIFSNRQRKNEQKRLYRRLWVGRIRSYLKAFYIIIQCKGSAVYLNVGEIR